jgi:hypothetical protein
MRGLKKGVIAQMWDLYKAIWSRICERRWTYILRDAWHKIDGLWITLLAENKK